MQCTYDFNGIADIIKVCISNVALKTLIFCIFVLFFYTRYLECSAD